MNDGCRWLATLACAALTFAGCSSRGLAVDAPPSAPLPAPAPVGAPEYTLYRPPTLPASGPVRLLIALHGIGGNGADFAENFMPVAGSHGWLLVAPTFTYGNWFDPAVVRAEDVALCRQLLALVGDVAQRAGRTLMPRAYVVGFSRGAQVADRFALFEPDHVEAVGSLSAGTYTLPEPAQRATASSDDALPLPFGTADMADWLGHGLDADELRRIRFWISVGADDDNPSDIPRQWDPVLGRTRVARARTFERSLRALDVSAKLTVFPGAQHQLTPEMTEGVSLFLAGRPG